MPEKRLVRIRNSGPIQMEERLFFTSAEELERAKLNTANTAEAIRNRVLKELPPDADQKKKTRDRRTP